MEHHCRGSRQVRYKVGEDMRTAGSAGPGPAHARRGQALEYIRGSWRRRAGATGVLLAVIAVTLAMAG